MAGIRCLWRRNWFIFVDRAPCPTIFFAFSGSSQKKIDRKGKYVIMLLGKRKEVIFVFAWARDDLKWLFYFLQSTFKDIL